MTATLAAPATATEPQRPARTRRVLSPTASLWLLASIVTTFLAGSSAPTPLYAVYQAKWGFTPITTTVVFGIYALAVLSALLVAGRLSDHVGRRPVLLAGIAVQMASMIVFTFAEGVSWLLVARVVQGLSTGAAVGAIGAAMLDIDRSRGTVANAVAPITGTATGSLISGLFVQYLPAPTHLIYLVLFGVLALQAVGVYVMRETVARTGTALASLRPEVALPRAVRPHAAIAIPVLIAVWSLGGLYGSLGPALLRSVAGTDSTAVGGLALFVVAGTGALTMFVLRDTAAPRLMSIGVVALVIGVASTVAALATASISGFFVGSIIAGVGFGGGFQGAIRLVIPAAEPHQRAGVLSVIYTVSYLALGLPAVIAGVLVVHAGGLQTTAREYGVAVMVLAAAAFAALIVRRRTAIATD